LRANKQRPSTAVAKFSLHHSNGEINIAKAHCSFDICRAHNTGRPETRYFHTPKIIKVKLSHTYDCALLQDERQAQRHPIPPRTGRDKAMSIGYSASGRRSK
jgi:hypothetical protein